LQTEQHPPRVHAQHLLIHISDCQWSGGQTLAVCCCLLYLRALLHTGNLGICGIISFARCAKAGRILCDSVVVALSRFENPR